MGYKQWLLDTIRVYFDTYETLFVFDVPEVK